MDSVCVDEEESEFPRGGKETLTPLEKKLIKQQAQQDLLFGEVSSKLKCHKTFIQHFVCVVHVLVAI